jgi:hypothetical protein
MRKPAKREDQTCAPSGLLSTPPEEATIYGLLDVGCRHVSLRPSISSQNYLIVIDISTLPQDRFPATHLFLLRVA